MRNGGSHECSGVPTSQVVRIAKWSGKWRVILGQGSGKGKRRITTCDSAAEAVEVAANLSAQIEAGAFDTPSAAPTMVSDLVERWIEVKSLSRIRKSTLAHYRQMAVPILARLGTVPVVAVLPSTIDRYCRDRLDAGKADATVEDERAIIRMIFGLAASKDWWKGDPKRLGEGIELRPSNEKRWLEVEQVGRFLEGFTDPTMQVLAALGVYAGLRLGESLNLQWSAVDLRRQSIHVRPLELQSGYSWRPKTSSSIRVVEIPAVLVEMLKSHRRYQQSIGIPLRWVVATRDGERRRSSRHPLNAVAAACKRADVPRVTYHELRHTWVTMLHDAGVPLSVISAMAGHESEVVTRKVYRHLTDHQRREAAGRLQGLLQAARRPATTPATCNGSMGSVTTVSL